ncbi:MAG: MFS transporter [Chloroflexi bacterium]|nr:MFS transporter [Chloroflexota bacterium]
MFQALRNRNIALLFSGQVISIAGDLVLFIALPFWVYQLTGSAMATGFMFAALTIPQLVFSPIAGVFVDRLDRKRLMIASDLIRAALMLCYLVVNTADQVWIIYLLAFAESAVSQFFRPSVMAVVPNLVHGEEELTRANALLGASWALGQLGGPALGGVLVATFGPHAAALFDAGTYVISAMFVALLRVPKREPTAAKLNDARQAIGQIGHELLEGVRVVLARPVLRVVFVSMAILFLSQGIINVLLIVIVNEIWHVGATEFGWFVSVEGIGGLLGTALIGAVAARVSPKQLVIVGGVIAGLILMVIVNQPSIYVAMGLIVFAMIGIIGFDVGLTTLIQMGSDDANRGRVSGLMQTTMAAAELLAIGATSLLADQVGAVLLLNIAAVLFSLGGLAAIFAPSAPKNLVAPNVAPQPAE